MSDFPDRAGRVSREAPNSSEPDHNNSSFSDELSSAKKHELSAPSDNTTSGDHKPGDDMDFVDHVIDGVEELGVVGWETVKGLYDMAEGAADLAANLSVEGMVVDAVGQYTDTEIPAYLPSANRGLQSLENLGETSVAVAEAVVDNPKILIASHLENYNKHLYGALVGGVIFEVVDLFFGSHGSTKAGRIMRLVAKLEDPAEFARLTKDLAEVKKLLKANPDEAQATLNELRTTLDAIEPDKLSYGGKESLKHLKQQLAGEVDDITNELPSHVLPLTETREGGLLLRFGMDADAPPSLRQTKPHEIPTGEYTYQRNPAFTTPAIRYDNLVYISGQVEERALDISRALSAKNFPDIDRWLEFTTDVRDELDTILVGCRSHLTSRKKIEVASGEHIVSPHIDSLTDTEKVFQLGRNLQVITANSQHVLTFIEHIGRHSTLSAPLDAFLEKLQSRMMDIENRMLDELDDFARQR